MFYHISVAIPTTMPQNRMTKVAVFVKKRVTSLANVPKKKINPRGVVSSVERKAIAKPIVLMKLRMAAVIKGAVSRYLFLTSFSLKPQFIECC